MNMEADEEPVEWMNAFLGKFWLIFEPVLCTLILENLDAVIGEYLPSFVESVKLTTLTLGTKPFRIESVKTYLNTDPDTVCMDWRVSFIPNDRSDLTPGQMDRHVNPRIKINIHMTKSLMGVVLPVQVEDISFHGHMRVQIRFMNKFPYAKVFEASFLNKPDFDYNLRPFGTDTLGIDVNVIPGLQAFVRDQAHGILGPMMYHPNVFTFDVEKFFAGELDISQANGILAVTVTSATALDRANEDGGPFATRPRPTLNPYIRFSLDNMQELGRTTVRTNTMRPEWNDTRFLLLNNLNGQLCLDLCSQTQNPDAEDDRVATAYFNLRELDDEDRNEQEGLDLALLHKGNSISDLKVDMRYFPVSKPVKHEDGTVDPAPESNSAVLRITVHECQNLLGPSRMKPYVRVLINGEESIRTSSSWHRHNPVFEVPGETAILDKSEVFIRVEVKDRSTVHKDVELGVWTSHLDEMLRLQEENEGWWPLKSGNEPVGSVRLSAQWKPVIMPGLRDGASGHGYDAPPIGVMRLTFWEARDLRNVENVASGKSDPYVRVLSGYQIRERTNVIDNNLSPEWGETLYVPVHSPKEDLVLEVMDWNAKTRDKSLGLVELSLKDLVQLRVGDQSENPDKWYEGTNAIIDQWTLLRSADRRPGKGELRYRAEFYPTLTLPKPRTLPTNENQEQQAPENVNTPTTPTTPIVTSVTTSEQQNDKEFDQNIVLDLPLQDLHGSFIKYTPDDLVDLAAYSCGVLRIKIHEVKFPRHIYAYCQVVADALLPQYKTARLKGRKLEFNEMTDVFIKEADISRVAIEVKPATTDEKDDSKLGYWLEDIKRIIRHIQIKRREHQDDDDDTSEWYSLFGGGEMQGSIRLSFDYIPMSSFILSPDESIDNQGTLTASLIRGVDLKAADKSGTSDPYVVFTVNGDRVHKSAVVKKTLNPTWKNEQFTVPIQSRVTASFRIEVFDWNQIQGDEPIGSGGITLRGDMVESFGVKDVNIPLDGVAGVTGSIRVRFKWDPHLLVKRKTQTSILGATTRIGTSTSMSSTSSGGLGGVNNGPRPMTSMSSLALSEGGGMHSRSASEAGSGIIRKSSTDLASIATTIEDEKDLSDTAGVDGMLTVRIIEARGLKGVDKSGTSDPYVRVRIDGHSVYKTKAISKTLAPTWGEEFIIQIPGHPTPIRFKVKDFNKLSRAVDLGESRYNIWDLIRPDQRQTDRWLPLDPLGSGEIHIILEFSPH
ncbi:C2 domain-containing protein [Phascolomyces articulosus]|uniref:C2 domain-containing protein n=1 Tax=Phascolomyces articulosus TaxID=60185 RepID=A0AAD5KGR1_9FUNG|nr:C2 domain-containing protein [Phascolomyces articulosus]